MEAKLKAAGAVHQQDQIGDHSAERRPLTDNS